MRLSAADQGRIVATFREFVTWRKSDFLAQRRAWFPLPAMQSSAVSRSFNRTGRRVDRQLWLLEALSESASSI